jgi:hypothetical protein
LEKTHRKLADVSANIVSLQAKRAERLISDDGIEEIAAIDSAIEAERRSADVYRDRIQALKERAHKEKRNSLERQRDASIKAIQSKLIQRERIALELETIIAEMGDRYFALAEFPSPLASDWPFPMPSVRLDLKGVNREMSLALYAAARPIAGQIRMPQAAALDSGVQGRGAESLSSLVTRQHENLIAALRAAPLGEEPESEAA